MNNVYQLKNVKSDTVQGVTFYELFEDGTYREGTTIEEMLTVSLNRLQDLNNRFSCRENALAITKIQEAIMWLNQRTADRLARGVEGQHKQ